MNQIFANIKHKSVSKLATLTNIKQKTLFNNSYIGDLSTPNPVLKSEITHPVNQKISYDKINSQSDFAKLIDELTNNESNPQPAKNNLNKSAKNNLNKPVSLDQQPNGLKYENQLSNEKKVELVEKSIPVSDLKLLIQPETKTVENNLNPADRKISIKDLNLMIQPETKTAENNLVPADHKISINVLNSLLQPDVNKSENKSNLITDLLPKSDLRHNDYNKDLNTDLFASGLSSLNEPLTDDEIAKFVHTRTGAEKPINRNLKNENLTFKPVPAEITTSENSSIPSESVSEKKSTVFDVASKLKSMNPEKVTVKDLLKNNSDIISFKLESPKNSEISAPRQDVNQDFKLLNNEIKNNFKVNVFNSNKIEFHQNQIIRDNSNLVTGNLSDTAKLAQSQIIPELRALKTKENLKTEDKAKINLPEAAKEILKNEKNDFSVSDYLNRQNNFSSGEKSDQKISRQIKFDLPAKAEDSSLAKMDQHQKKSETVKYEDHKPELPKAEQQIKQNSDVAQAQIGSQDIKITQPKPVSNLTSELTVKTTPLTLLKPEEFPGFVMSKLPDSAGYSVSSAQIALKPETLGLLNVDISIRHNIANISITAESAEAFKAIESQLPVLKDKLIQNGLQAERIDIRLKENDTAQNSFSEGRSNQNQQDAKDKRDYLRSFNQLRYNYQNSGMKMNYNSNPYNQLIFNKLSVV